MPSPADSSSLPPGRSGPRRTRRSAAPARASSTSPSPVISSWRQCAPLRPDPSDRARRNFCRLSASPATLKRDPVMFLRALSRDLAIDLGTANTLVFVRGEGVVLREPSIVAVDETDRSVIAVGNEAKAMLGKTPPHIRVVQPLKEGVIADFEITERMLSYLIAKTQRWLRTVLKPRVVIGVPSGITQVERRAVRDSAKNAGAHEVYLVEEPVAAAIGAGLPVQDPGGNLIVDIGGGTTEVAVISLAGVIFCTSV